MAAAEGANTVEHRGDVSIRRHLEVDPHGGVERDAHRPHVRNETPNPRLADSSSSRAKNGLEAVVLPVPMKALAEKERITRAVIDFVYANVAVDVEDAVP